MIFFKKMYLLLFRENNATKAFIQNRNLLRSARHERFDHSVTKLVDPELVPK
jgi:hypothetical protein